MYKNISDVLGSMPDSYSPKYVEAAWYPWWEKQVLDSSTVNICSRHTYPCGWLGADVLR